MSMEIRTNAATQLYPMPALYKQHISAGPRYFRAGQRIYSQDGSGQDVFMVEQGQVVVMRDLQPIDLVEAGEPLFTQLYPDAEFTARTNCVLSPYIAPAAALR